MIIIFPKPNFRVVAIAPNDRFPHRWKAEHFPVTIEADHQVRTGSICIVQIKVDMGKNRERTASYVSGYKLRLLKSNSSPTHELIWTLDSGKFAYSNKACDRIACFPGNNGGWLILTIAKLEGVFSSLTPD